MADIGMAAFSAFFMQSPSFLSHQIQLRAGAGHGRSNCETLFGMQSIPSDNHIRDMLDFVEPSSLDGLFDEALTAVERAGALAPLNRLDGRMLIALDGTEYFCSSKLSCRHCSTRKRANGVTEFHHTMLAASIVTPGRNLALPLPPEFVRPPDGHDKQDCESRAARRWLLAHGERYRRFDPVYLGDHLYAHQSLCEAVLASGGHFLFVCKPDSHKTLYEYLTGIEMACLSKPVKRGKQRATHAWRWLNAVPIRHGEDALMVNWLGLTIRNANGEITYRNSFVSDLPIDASRVEGMAEAGGRGGKSKTKPSTCSKRRDTISNTTSATEKAVCPQCWRASISSPSPSMPPQSSPMKPGTSPSKPPARESASSIICDPSPSSSSSPHGKTSSKPSLFNQCCPSLLIPNDAAPQFRDDAAPL